MKKEHIKLIGIVHNDTHVSRIRLLGFNPPVKKVGVFARWEGEMIKRFGDNWKMKTGIILMFAYTLMSSYILIGSWLNGIMFGQYQLTTFTNLYGEAVLEAWVLTPIVLSFAFYTFIKGRKL